MTTYIQQHKRDQSKNPCFEYTKDQIKAINKGANINAIEPEPVTRRTLNSRRAPLYDVLFSDGLQANDSPLTLAEAKALVLVNGKHLNLKIVPKW
ncbi:MAG: hypothetical protein NZ811_00050 [Gammaproteobacteria bacterium]|nr:hypothetical protein [Gammaproteobacteria bacterium]